MKLPELKIIEVNFKGLSLNLRESEKSQFYTSYKIDDGRGDRKIGVALGSSASDSLKLLSNKVANLEYFSGMPADVRFSNVVCNMENQNKVIAIFYKKVLIALYNPKTNKTIDINLEKIFSFAQLSNTAAMSVFINSD